MTSQLLTYSLPARQASRVSSTIHLDGKFFDVWYQVSSGPLADGVESFLVAALVPAMKRGCTIRTPGPISHRLYHGLQQYQQVLQRWFPYLKPITIETDLRPDVSQTAAPGVGSFFSAGVDACYTFLQHREELSTCILIHGFDYQQSKELIRQTVSGLAQQAMKELGKPLLEVDTNIRSFGDQYADWGKQYHGCVLASVALLLAPQLQKVYIASSFTPETLFPWGSHPETDHLLSSDRVEVVHDDITPSRSQKISHIALSDCDAVLKVLRVCWSDFHKTGSSFNCGKCEKCLRTMLDLRIAGALDRCKTFRHPLQLKRVARIDASHTKTRAFYLGSYAEAQKKNDPELLKALEECLSNRHHKGCRGVLNRLRKYVRQNITRPCIRPIERIAQRLSRLSSVSENSSERR